MTDLKGTLAALSEAATQGEWAMRAHVIAPATASSKALDRWKLNVQHGPLGSLDRQDAEFIIAICNAYRSGQLVPVPSVEVAARAIAGEVWHDEPNEVEQVWPDWMGPAAAVIAAMKGEGRGDG